jgi:hypothetical protein
MKERADGSASWGGIPPDEDHKLLMVCCYPGCLTEAKYEPLVVVAHEGQMRTYCCSHLTFLTGRKRDR